MAIISIIVPVYNIPEIYLRRCLDSVRDQSFQEIEAIVVDDGSEQWCADICDEYGAKSQLFHIIHQKNCGLSASRNTGCLNAHAKWFMFLDGDDWLEQDICERLAGCIDDKMDLITFGFIRDTGNSSRQFPMPYLKDTLYVGKECEQLRNSILEHENYFSSSWGKLYNKKFMDEHLLEHDIELRCGIEGIEFTFRVLDKAKAVYTSPYYGLHYIYNNNSMSSRPDEKTNRLILSGLSKIEKYIDENVKDEMIKKMLYKRAMYTVMATATRSYFNPSSNLSYKERKQLMKDFLGDKLICKAMQSSKIDEFPKSKRLLLTLIKNHLFIGIYIYSILGYLYREVK